MKAAPRIAISLGASFMGYATHAGFMARLHALGVRPVAVGGASAGAITAGLCAAGLEPEAIRHAVLSPRLYLSFARRTRWVWHQFVDIFWRRHPGFFDPRGAVEHFESLVGAVDIATLAAPRLMIALTDLARHETLFATRGPLARAMAASCCVPTLFSPLEFEGRLCNDGGVAHEIPIESWITADDIDIIVMHRITQPERRPPLLLPGKLIATIAASHTLMGRQIMADRKARARENGKRVVVATTFHPRPSPVFPGRLKNGYALGEATAQQLYDEELKALL